MSSSLVLVAPALLLAASAVRWHRGRRHELYRKLARKRASIVVAHAPIIASTTDPGSLRERFALDGLIRVGAFLTPESLAALKQECATCLAHVERSYLPGHKKGGTLSYEGVQRFAPASLAVYHSADLQRWLGEVVGEPLRATPDQDQSSCSLLYYTEPGDHINWHYDHNFYRGRHFTILLAVVNRSADGALSAGSLQRKSSSGDLLDVDTSENTLVIFEGARVLHRASPVAPGDRRVMLSMTLCTDPRNGVVAELARRIKDTAYFGFRALVD